jgi:hypothetical protein
MVENSKLPSFIRYWHILRLGSEKRFSLKNIDFGLQNNVRNNVDYNDICGYSQRDDMESSNIIGRIIIAGCKAFSYPPALTHTIFDQAR